MPAAVHCRFLLAFLAHLPLAALAKPITDTVPHIVISEVQPAPLLLEDAAGEYVELAHLGPTRVAVADLALTLPSGRTVTLERARKPWLEPGEVAIGRTLGGDGAVRVPGMRLPDGAGRLELRWRGVTIDVAQWLRVKPGVKVRPGVALERVTPDSDGERPSSWRASRTPVHVVERGSPGHVFWPTKVRESKGQKREPGHGRPGSVASRWGGT